MNEIEKLKQENKQLKQSNRFLIIYVVISIVILLYNSFIA